jgi:hypothetical protein
MSELKKAPFFKMVLRFAAGFLVFFSLFKIILKIFKTSFDEMIAAYFGPETWHLFALQMIVGSLFYGLFIAGYYKFIKK